MRIKPRNNGRIADRSTARRGSKPSHFEPRRHSRSIRWLPVLGALLLGTLAGRLVPARPTGSTAGFLAPAHAAIVSNESTPAQIGQRPTPHAASAVDHSSFRYSAVVADRLARVRAQKKDAILALFADVERAARRVAHDETMLTGFFNMQAVYRRGSRADGSAAPREAAALDKYRQALGQYYALNYNRFHDILFVAPDQYVFYSFRFEPDFHTRIGDDSPLADGLRRCLEGDPHEVVTDYHFYEPSQRAAAFFILPVVRDDQHAGWIIVQYAVNVLDSLLVDNAELGETGEVYLLNHEQRMLTDSRFNGERTHLQYTVDAIDPAGPCCDHPQCALMNDYRGVRVFSSYERIATLGQEWVLVAQMDEAEVITDYYREHEADCRAALLTRLRTWPIRAQAAPQFTRQPVFVGMDEFAKTRDGRPLATRGVSTCTAVAITCPGRFGYLAHVSPYDKIYGSAQLTNILKQVVTRIRHYDIYQNEIPKLQVVVVAPHTESLAGVLTKLMKYDVRLNQVRFAWNPEADYADVQVSPDGSAVTIEWLRSGTAESPPESVIQCSADLPDLGTLLRTHCRLAD